MPPIPPRSPSPEFTAAPAPDSTPAHEKIRIDKGKQRAFDPPLLPPSDNADPTVRPSRQSQGAPQAPSPLDAAFFSAPSSPASPIAAAVPAAAGPKVRLMTEGWEEAAHGTRSTVHVLYTPTGESTPIELVVSLSKRHRFTKAACAGDSPEAVAHREEFEAFLVGLMTQCEKSPDIGPDWRHIRLTLDKEGIVQNVVALRANAKLEEVVAKNDPFMSVGRWMHNLVRGYETVEIRRPDKKPADDRPSKKELDEKASEARRQDQAQHVDIYTKAAYLEESGPESAEPAPPRSH